MRYLSLCSGIEAATVAWHPMDWEPAAFAEIEAFPAAVLKHHYPNTPNLGDMTKWREWNVGPIDLLVGGTPCQSFSVAGLRKGLSDPRGGLMLTFLEIAQSLRPRWVVWENVPGVLSSGGGRDFGSFLGALGELGYGWAYRVLDAQWCRVDGYERAVPQRRRRVFVVGCLGDATRAAKVLFERQSVERNPAPRRAKGQGAAADAEDGVETGGWMPNNPGVVSSVCAKWAKKTGGPSGSAHFNLTMEPAAKWPAEVCSTLNASFGEKQGLEDQHALGGAQCFVPAVAGTIDCDIPKQNASGAQRMPDKANFGAVLQPICIDRSAYNQGQNAKWDCPIEQSDAMFGLIARGPHAVAVNVSNGEPRISEVSGTLDAARESRGSNQQRFVMEPFRKSHRAASATDDESWVRAETATVAVAFDWQKGNDVGNPRPSTMNIAEEHSMTLGTTRVPAVAHGFYSTGGTHGVNMEPEVSPAVKVGSGLGIPSPPAVAFKPSHFTRGKDGSPADITPPLSADADKGDQDTVVAYPIDGRNAMRDPEKHDEINRQGVGVGNAGDPSHTVTSAAVHAVAAIAPSLTASNDPSRSPQSAEVTQHAVGFSHSASSTSHGVAFMVEGSPPIRGGGAGNSMPAVATQMVVRRLTPVECERLQGFPDDYTNIPWRGKPEAPDGPRYKALGNSMAVNCMRWIGRRIDAVEKGTELPA